MRIHTSLSEPELREILCYEKRKWGHVASSVTFTGLSQHGSRTHPRAFEVQLGAKFPDLPDGWIVIDLNGKRMTRRRRNMSDTAFAATHHEWGWFLAALFRFDPEAMAGSPRAKNSGRGYDGEADFHRKTDDAFRPEMYREGKPGCYITITAHP